MTAGPAPDLVGPQDQVEAPSFRRRKIGGSRSLRMVLVLVVAAGLAAWTVHRVAPVHLSAPGGIGMAGPAAVGELVSIGGPWLCSTGSAPVRLTAVEPATRVGNYWFRAAVHIIDIGAPTDLVGSGHRLPASYVDVRGAEVPMCGSSQRLVLGFEMRRLDRASAAVASLRIRYHDVWWGRTVVSDTSFGLCGDGGTAGWPGLLADSACTPVR